MARFQVVEVDHSPLTALSRLSSLLLNAIGNIRQSLYDPPGTTPRLKDENDLSGPVQPSPTWRFDPSPLQSQQKGTFHTPSTKRIKGSEGDDSSALITKSGALPKQQPKKKVQVISSLFNYNPKVPTFSTSSETSEENKEQKERVFSGDKFSDLDISAFMVSNLENNLRLTSMTSVQKAAIPSLLEGRDVFVKSKTGTGKTLTYAVPVIHSLQKIEPKITRSDGPYAVILVPTRELAIQSFDVLQKLVKPFQWVVPGIVTGGEKRKSEKARIRKGINVLVATPGRLLDHIEKTKCLELQRMRWIVLDEADRLLDLGFEKDVSSILTAVKKSLFTGIRCQTVLLSATLNEGVERLVGVSLHNPLFIDVTAESRGDEGKAESDAKNSSDVSYTTPQQLKQFFIVVPSKLRLVTLAAFLLWKNKSQESTAAKMIVFLSSRDSVDFHCDLLKESLHSFSKVRLTFFKLHGNMSQSERTGVFKSFSEAKSGILFCTDVAARGNALLFITPAEVEYLETLKQHGISPEELLVNEVLKTLVVSSIDTNRKKLKNVLDQRAQESATNLQISFEDHVLSDQRYLKAAKTAYQSFVRAYATYPAV
ncbi:ATPdependent RNA helicase [Desmophyllum pertusum]|uniref:ATP-dependent RNA helicase n=1 Tax=Desmophyllum pertusum TaxID=174260 RepID=A0A9W9YUX5_9CNID|nr:ATPdependent RNA helicase [Desmophyllum pertusum]